MKVFSIVLMLTCSPTYCYVIRGIAPLICGLNEEPTNCVEPCLPTCDIPKTPFCTYKLCLGGCVCREGYIREKIRGNCVPITSCLDPAEIRKNHTVTCKENEKRSECQSNCEPTCARRTVNDCTKLFCAHGCVCKDGYIRERGGGDCVSQEKCH